MKVRDFMTTEVKTATLNMTAHEIAQVLSGERFGALPVLDAEDKVVGVVSDSDLVSQDVKVTFPSYFAFADGYLFAPGKLRAFEEQLKRSSSNTAAGLMSSPAFTISPEAELSDAATLMTDNHVDQLPVVEDDKLVGIISKGDIVRWMSAQSS